METFDLFDHATRQAVEMRRLFLARRLMEATGGVVQHGLLAGFRLGAMATWREGDNGAKLLGLYEKEVLDLLGELAAERRVLADLGGADGFYAVGLVAMGKYRESHCFEIVEASRENIALIARQAGVADRVRIHGAATAAFPAQLAEQGVDLAQAVVLCDIEGGEFEILDRGCLESLRRAHVIIEIHEFMRPDWREGYSRFLESLSAFHDVRELKTGARDLSDIPLLSDHWTDSDRWLICSEGRAKLMSWLHLSPRRA